MIFFKVSLTPEFYQLMSRTNSVNEFYFEGVGCEREGLVPRGVWGWVQGVALAQGVTRSVRQSVWGVSEGQEEPSSRLALAV